MRPRRHGIRIGSSQAAMALTAALFACSQGGQGPGADLGEPPAPVVDLGLPVPDQGALPDLSQRPDLAPPGTLVPVWVKTVQGGLTSWGPHVAVLPAADETSAPQIVGAFTKGYDLTQITVGSGDPGQALVTGNFKPVLAWLDARDGRVLRALQVAQDTGPVSPVVPQAGIDLTPAGEVLVGGQFHGTTVFFYGSAAPQTQSTAVTPVGMSDYRAQDPFLARYGTDGKPGWLTRGRTAGPLTMNWANYGEGLAALPDGGALFVGKFDGPGFSFPATGGKTFTGGSGSYVARIGPTGAATWVGRNDGALSLSLGVRAGADGSAYVLGYFGGPATLLADSPAPVALTPQAGRYSFVLAKLTPAGSIAWVRRIVSDGNAPTGFTVTASGRAVVCGIVKGKIDALSDGDHVDATRTSAEIQGYAASWRADGTFEWLTLLGEPVELATQITERSGSGEVFVAASVPSSVRSLPLDDGGPVSVPDLTMGQEASVHVVYRLSATGRRVAADVVGVNLPLRQIVGRAGLLLMTGAYGDWATDVRLGPPGSMQALPPSIKGQDQRVFWTALRVQ